LLNVSIDATPNEIVVRDVGQFSLARIFRSLLRSYPGRIDDPSQADLLFIDTFTETGFSLRKKNWHCNKMNPILELQHLHKDNAHKHVLISPRCAGDIDVCPWFDSAYSSQTEEGQLFAKMFKLALEDPVSGSTTGRGSEASSVFSVYSLGENGTLQLEKKWRPPIAANLHSIPYPSFRSGLLPSELEQYKAVVAGANRTYLASAIWGTHGSALALKSRISLQEQCNRSHDCIFVDVGDFRSGSDTHKATSTHVVVSTMLKSKFCLQPEGDTPSRKSLIDAVTLGCIPVLMTKRQQKLWPWHVNWDNVSVQVDYNSDVLDYLRNIPESVVNHKQIEMSKLSDLVSYGKSEHGHRALDVVLEAVTASSAASIA